MYIEYLAEKQRLAEIDMLAENTIEHYEQLLTEQSESYLMLSTPAKQSEVIESKLLKFLQTAVKVHQAHPLNHELRSLVLEMALNIDYEISPANLIAIGSTSEEAKEVARKPKF